VHRGPVDCCRLRSGRLRAPCGLDDACSIVLHQARWQLLCACLVARVRRSLVAFALNCTTLLCSVSFVPFSSLPRCYLPYLPFVRLAGPAVMRRCRILPHRYLLSLQHHVITQVIFHTGTIHTHKHTHTNKQTQTRTHTHLHVNLWRGARAHERAHHAEHAVDTPHICTRARTNTHTWTGRSGCAGIRIRHACSY
jgi:hypothetical protein